MPWRFSVKTSTRRSFQRGGASAGDSPNCGRPGHRFARIQSARRRVLASGRPRERSATCCMRSRSRRSRSGRGAWDTTAASAAPVRASMCSFSSASISSSSHPPRSSSASGGVRNGSCRRFPAAGSSVEGPSAPFPATAGTLSPAVARHCRSTVARCTAKPRANASIDESRRCCRPTTSSPAAARARLDEPRWRCSRASRYSSSRRDSTSSGASSGRPAISMRSITRRGNPSWICRTSSFSRRTMTSSSSLRPRTFTPRVKR